LIAKSSFFKSSSKTLSVKQPAESKFQQVDFSLPLENIYFSKGLKSNNIGSSHRVNNKFKYSRHTHNQQQGFSCIPLGFGDIKAPCSTISPYLMKTNPWFACVVYFEFDGSCKTEIVHIQGMQNNRITPV